MTWVRLDDKFWRNQKMRKLSHAARGVFCDCLSFCGDVPEDQLTGFLTAQQAIDRATGRRRLLIELTDNGNLEPVNGGYLIHDFPDYLPKTSRDRTRAWRERKRQEEVTTASPKRHRDRAPSRARDGQPAPEPAPDPGVENPPSVGSPSYGIPAVTMHVHEETPLSQTLNTLRLQSANRQEAG